MSCLSFSPDFQFATIAFLIAAASVVSSLKCFGQARACQAVSRGMWLVLAGAATASGLWSAHIVGMAALGACIPLSYDLGSLGLALAAGSTAVASGYWIAADGDQWLAYGDGDLATARSANPWTIDDRSLFVAAGGIIIGLGLSTMSFMAISSLKIAPILEWDVTLSTLSVAVGIAVFALALLVHWQLAPPKGAWVAGGLMWLGAVGIHLLAVAALAVVPDAASAPASGEDRIALAVAVTLAAAFTIGVGAVAHTLATVRDRLAASAREVEAKSDDAIRLTGELADARLKLEENEAELIKRGKLAQLGQLIATVAHEIRNPLGTVKTAAFLLERVLQDKPHGLERHLSRINTGIARCEAIIAELLDFARTKPLILRALPIADWVRQIADEEAKKLPQGITVKVRSVLGSETVAHFDADRMRQVLNNLLSNAAEAMVGRGPEAPAAVVVDPRIVVSTHLNGDRFEIEVEDNGPGISDENIQKILEPLFTTKSWGVGLGLSAVQKILEQHGGGLTVRSTSGKGATFTAWFPVKVPRTAMAAA